MVFLLLPTIRKIRFKDVKSQREQKNMYLTMYHTIPKILLFMEKSPVEDEDVEIIGIRPAISRTFLPIVRNM